MPVKILQQSVLSFVLWLLKVHYTNLVLYQLDNFSRHFSCQTSMVKVNIRILVPEKNNTLRDEQGNYAGQGTARRTYYMLHTGGNHFEALKALGEVEPIDGWTVQEVWK